MTPIRYVAEIDANHVHIKREDLLPFSFGGNKARKAELFFRKIDAGDYDCVVTYGSSSSNHCRVVSNMAAARGLPCYIIGPQEASKATFNSRMMELFGAQIHMVPVAEVHDTIENTLHRLRDERKKPYFIPGGGHGNLGTQAYVDCYEEICAYERENGLRFDYIFFASGTGTTQAGLVCGQLMRGDTDRIIGISVARKNPRGRQVVLDSVAEYLAEHAPEIPAAAMEAATVFIDEYTAAGYARQDADINATIRDMLCRYGIPMDSTYTAKAFCGMKKYLEKENIRGRNILFIHTGGTPLFFDDLETMT